MIRYRGASPGFALPTPPDARSGLLGRLTRQEVRAAVAATAFSKGERYWMEGDVVGIAVHDSGARIEARVLGTAPQPYQQSIRLIDRRGLSVQVAGVCTCPVGSNCKHVAAALLAAMEARDAERQGGARTVEDAGVAILPDAGSTRIELDPALSSWVDALARLERTETDAYPPDLRQRLIYLLGLHAAAAGLPYLVVRPTSVRLLKDDSFSTSTTPYPIESGTGRNHALYIRPADRAILDELYRLPRPVHAHPGVALSGDAGAAVLDRMLATGRTRWETMTGPALAAGPPRHGRIAWTLAADGSHHATVALEHADDARAVRLAPPHYVDAATGQIGPIATGLPPRTADAVLSAPPVPPRQAGLLRAAIARRIPALAAVEPPAETRIDRIAVTPIPRLSLFSARLPSTAGYTWNYREPMTEEVPLARLTFRYGEFIVDAADPRDVLTFARSGRVVEVERSSRAEHAAWGHLGGTSLAKLGKLRGWGVPEEHRNDLEPREEPKRAGWIDLLHRHLPRLRGEGWDIDIADGFPIRVVEAEGPMDAALREGSGIDWFELELGVMLDGVRLDLVPVLLPLLGSDAFAGLATADASRDAMPVHLPLPDGRTLIMAAGRLRPILAALHELFAAGVIDAKSKKVGFSPFDAPSLAELEAAAMSAGAAWRGGERLRELGRLLRATGGIPAAVLPATFTGALRPYQARGVDWLQFLRGAGLGGVLADEMGLGKTVQTLAHLAIEHAEGRLDRPALIVCPTSLVPNWRREAERFAPGLKVLVLHGVARKARFADIAGHNLVITTYPLLPRDHVELIEQDWQVLVLDEAQTIKNPEATTTRLLRAFKARHRLCLTGTPLENHLGELWSLFAFLSPGFLGDRTAFTRQWRTPIEKRGDTARRRLLARRVRPFLLRRTKAEVVTELPPKTEIQESVEMETGQRDVYESIRLAMHKRVREAIAERGLARSRIVVLDALLKLRQSCCDPRLLKLKTAAARKAGSAKLERLMAMLAELLEGGRRILLFSQFTSMLALIEDALRAAGIKYVLLTGDTRDRETPIQRFQSGEVPLFLISLKAGGLGLNLTAADTVIHYDPWWNPAVEDQATDRAHRIGQDKPVFVHKLVMLASIEEKMEALKAKKRDLAAGLFDPDAGSALDLTEADVEDLFGPA